MSLNLGGLATLSSITVCPPIARALVAANVGELVAMERMERAA